MIPATEQDAIWKYQHRLRVTEYHLNARHRLRYLFSRFLLHQMQFRYGMKIRINSCGKGLKIMHLGSLLTNGDVGEDCLLHVNVSIVSGGRDTGTPVIGSHNVEGAAAYELDERVDLYEVNGRVYFGEMTFFHWSGMKPFEPAEWDRTFGDWITLPEKK